MEKLDVNALDENTLSNWMTWSQHNELLCVKIPMIPKADCDFLLNTLKDIIDANEKVLTDYNKLIDDIK